MHIPHRLLSPVALRAVVEEFVTRDGTDHSPVEQRIALVLHQLDVGSVELHFDQETGTPNLLPKNEGGRSSTLRSSL
jgi:uncharacterized protein YheU (UPF0270 family)